MADGRLESLTGQTLSQKEEQMKTVVVAVLASFCIVTGARAEDTCKVQADGKNLYGAALTSFAKKCCNDQAAAQKLHGAAKTSYKRDEAP